MICRARLLPSASLLLLLGALAACSEAVPPASEGAFTLHFQSLPTGGKACKVKGHNSTVGYTTTKENRDLKKDTVGGARIFCAVGGGGAFDVEGFITLEGQHIDFSVNGVKAGATVDEPATGSLSFASPTTVVPYTSTQDVPCEFWFSKYQQIALGRAWMDFKCDQVANASTDSSCSIDVGTVAIQNCEQ